MADRAISALPTATTLTASDLFVLSQSNQAKNTTWQTIIGYLATALDGHGGIQSITYTPPVLPSLDGTLTITLADSTHYDVTVTNGNGVNGVVQHWAVSSSDSTTPSTWYTTIQTMTPTNKYLWNYMTLEMDDGNDIDTTPCVAGVYGDTGQAWYVWIRYAGSQPTSDADIGTTPDDWIGVYSGTESDPDNLHYTDFDWFQYKGATGATGAAATITTQNVSYQASNSGTVAPSGSWTTTIPTVPQGSFLWTRTQLQFNDGTTVTSYSVSRYGIDGTGAVSTVNGLSPDGNGNVEITASDIAMSDNQSIETNVTQLQTDVGDVADLTTSASTVVPAINELKTSLSAVKSDLGIVEDTNTATHTIAAGQYVIWKGALYTASAAIPLGTTLSASNLTAVSGGGLNSLQNETGAEYCKTPDGTLICWGIIGSINLYSYTPRNQNGFYIYDVTMSFSFPHAFSEKPYLLVNKSGGAASLTVWSQWDTTKITEIDFATVSAVPSSSAGGVTCAYIAIGKWK